jgi:hypothetical protein
VVVQLHEPGAYSTAKVGRLYVIHYRVVTTVATEQRIWDDYQIHCEQFSGRTPVLASSEHPLLPMPAVDVRKFWRGSLATGYGVEAIAVISRSFVGLAAAAMTNLLEHLVDPRLGTPFRVFSKPASAVAWLATFDLQAREAEISAQLEILLGLP